MLMKISTIIAGLTLVAAVGVCPQVVNAIPAIPTPVTVTLADGSQMTVRLHGDENMHYYTTEDNHLLVADEQGNLCYAKKSGARLMSSGVVAHSPALRGASELEYLRSVDATAMKELQGVAERQLANAKDTKAGGQFTDLFTAYPSIGSPRALILLVEFPDQKFVTSNPLQAFTNLMTQDGYSYNGATGSARDYFVENSRGLFTPEFDVFGPVTLPNSMAYYGRETANLHDANPYEMIADACKLIDGQVDFSLYDEDGDGMVDNVFVFYAGYGQNSGAPSHTIWPHAANIWTYGGIKLILDGVQVGNYACTNEIQGTSGSVRTGIGTFCHEFSHVLGLPDLYATDGTTSFTPGHFELMDVGPYLNDGNTPPYMSVYDRACLKWINPRELTVGETVVLKSFNDVQSSADDEALMITTISENEYYLLENRQKRGWDSYIPGHGMLVWHIDFDPQLWKDNQVNSVTKSQHLRVDIVEADGLADQSSWSGDPFPGTSNVTSFTDNTTPSMRTWTNVRVEKPITNIHEQDGVISFDILGGGDRIAAVEALEATEVSPLSFRANWTGRSEIYNYEIDLFKGDEVIPMESFTKQTDGLDDCYLDITGLTPATAYSYVVRAVSGDKKSANSQRVKVSTTPPTFDMLAVEALPAESVESNSFVARWQEMDNAVSYELNVYTKIFNEPTTEECDFTGGLSSLPEGWYTNATATSGMAGTYGASRPSLRLSANNDLLRTRTYDVDVNGISFWAKAAASTSGTLKLMGLINGSWTEVASFDASKLVSAAETIVVNESSTPAMPSGCKAVQLQFERTSGSLFVDDVTLYYNGATSRQYVDGYEAFKSLSTSHEVTGLTPGVHYFYTVSAISADDVRSLESNEIEVVTGFGAIDSVAKVGGVEVRMDGGNILLTNNSDAAVRYLVSTVSGILVANASIEPGCEASVAAAGGVYLVKVGNEILRINSNHNNK